MALATVPGKIAVFCEARFLFAECRVPFHEAFPPDRIYYITPRPSCPPGEFLQAGGKAEGGKYDCVWLIYDEREGRAESRWLS